MTAKKIKNFCLHLQIISFDYEKTEHMFFNLGEFFDLEGDLILDEVGKINFIRKTSYCCGNFIYINLKTIYPQKVISQIYHGIKTVEKDQC